MEQRTEEWYAARLGHVTASRIADVMAKTKTGYSTSRRNYMMELLCERLTGRRKETFQTPAMIRGTELEPKARAMYMLETGNIVEETGIVYHPTIAMSGASPDGLVNDDGLIEIKCPLTATHIDFMTTKTPKREYLFQMYWQMACTGRKWCDFVSYNDDLPENLRYRSVRIVRDDAKIKEIESEVISFLKELDEMIVKVEEL